MTELMDPNEHVIFERVARIIEAARAQGESRDIVKVELPGRERAEYGEQVDRRPAGWLTERFGEQLEEARRFTSTEDSQ